MSSKTLQDAVLYGALEPYANHWARQLSWESDTREEGKVLFLEGLQGGTAPGPAQLLPVSQGRMGTERPQGLIGKGGVLTHAGAPSLSLTMVSKELCMCA